MADNLPQGASPAEPTGALPAGASVFEAEPERPGIIQRIAQRFMGTDVEDPVEMPRLGATVAGGLAGSFAGARTPVAPGPAGAVVNPVTGAIAGGVIGTLTGAISPEATMAGAHALGLIDEETRARYSLSFEDMRTLAEGEALLELATGGTLAAGRLAWRGAGRLLTGPGKEGTEIAERAAGQGIELMPVQVGGRAIGRGYVAVMGRFPLIGTPIKKRGVAAEVALQTRIEGAPQRIAPITNWADVSERIFDDARDLVGKISQSFDARYTALWARADEAGVKVIPQTTLVKADEILAKIARQTPSHVAGEGTPGVALQRIKAFIETEILLMRGMVDSPIMDLAGKPITQEMRMSSQTLRQMDGLASKIDQELAALEPGQKRFAQSLYGQLRQAVQADALVNVRGTEAAEIGKAMRELDTEFSHTMSQLFETATAKRFGSVRRRGIRGITADEATRVEVDQLARLVVKLDSPQAIDELSRLVTPDTFQRITAHVMDDAISMSLSTTTGAGKVFDADKFARQLGLDKPTGARRQAVTAMLEKSGSPLTVKDFDDLIVAARSISGTEIPNTSTFLARRAVIGGTGTLLGAFMIGGAAVGNPFAIGSLFATAMMLGGGRLVSSIISTPESARALKSVIRGDASAVVRKEAYVRALRVGINAMDQEENAPGKQARFTFRNDMLDRVVRQLDAEEKAQAGE